VLGAIQFDPDEAEANGKAVRNIVIQQNGFGPTAVRVNATVWPSHAHIPLKKGDVVAIEGAYKSNRTTDQNGNERTFHNVSVTRLAVLGTVDAGVQDGQSSTASAADASDDEIPF